MENRYCINCGTQLGSERFCTKCGTDNGEIQPSGMTSNTNASVQMPTIQISNILHWITIVLFAILAINQFVACCKGATYTTAHSMLYQGGIILSILYFVIGMWTIIPALAFVLYGKTNRNKTIVGLSVVVFIITIALLIVNEIAKHASGFFGAFTVILAPYVGIVSNIIVFSILTIIAGIIAMRKEQ